MTINQIYRKIRITLDNAGVEFPEAESKILLEHVCGLDRSRLILYGENECSPEQEAELLRLCAERISGRPLQYILGEWQFYGGVFKVGEGVLIPRDDTEVLVEACIKKLKSSAKAAPRIIDLCAGSGIISVTLKREFSTANVTALEKSEKAFDFLKQNIILNNTDVTPVLGDVFRDADEFSDGEFDLIVSNPPYIKTEEINTLQSEVRREPEMALDGGADGYDFYRAIIKKWSKKLKKGGIIAFEIGEEQARSVSEMLMQNGFSDIEIHRDLGETERAINAVLL